MKRKRFVKLAMSYGVQRNEAERLAKLVCVLGSYEAVFAHYRHYLEGKRAIAVFQRIYKSVLRAVRPMVKTLQELFCGIDWATAAEDEDGESGGGVLTMAKISMRVILKSGVEFTTKCDKFTLTRNGLDQVTGYNISGITENKPVYLDFEQVAAIVRVLSDEDGEEAAETEE